MIKICVLINVIVPKLEYAGEAWQGNAKLVKQLETVQMAAAKKVPGCSSTTSSNYYSIKSRTANVPN